MPDTKKVTPCNSAGAPQDMDCPLLLGNCAYIALAALGAQTVLSSIQSLRMRNPKAQFWVHAMREGRQ